MRKQWKGRDISKLTIAIPFYSNVALLEHALKSAVGQTESDIEIIIVDDRGPDSAGAQTLVQKLGDSRIRYIQNEKNIGIGANWNRCIELASSSWVTLLHADDILAPNYAALMLKAAQANKDAAFIFCRAAIIDGAGQPTFSFADYVKKWIAPAGDMELRGDHGLASLLKGCFIMCPTICYQRSKVIHKPFNQSMRQVLDFDLYARLLLDGEFLVGIKEHAYFYRRHSANQTALLTASLVRFSEEVAFYDAIAQATKACGWNHSSNVAQRKTIIKLNLIYSALSDFAYRRFQGARQKLGLLLQLSR